MSEAVRRPRGVRLVADGFAQPVDERLRYVGRDEAGIQRWVVDLDEHEWSAVLHGRTAVEVTELPGRTSVGIALRDDRGGR